MKPSLYLYALRVTETVSESGYHHTHVHWSECDVDSVHYRLAGCEGNRAGYGGGQAVADQVKAKCEALLKAGQYYQPDTICKRAITVSFQLYSTPGVEPRQWCQPHYEIGTDYHSIHYGAKMVEKLHARGFETPEECVKIMADLGPTFRVEYFDIRKGALDKPDPNTRRFRGYYETEPVIVGLESVRPAYVKALKKAQDEARWKRWPEKALAAE
jgi:hypothetical protein